MTNSDKCYEEIERRVHGGVGVTLRQTGCSPEKVKVWVETWMKCAKRENGVGALQADRSAKAKTPRWRAIWHNSQFWKGPGWCVENWWEGTRTEWKQTLVRRLTGWSWQGMMVVCSRLAVVKKKEVCRFGIFFEGCVNNNPWSPGYSSFHLIKSFFFLIL